MLLRKVEEVTLDLLNLKNELRNLSKNNRLQKQNIAELSKNTEQMKKDIITLMILLAILFSCKKEDPLPTELPPITTEGKNTFGCLINGEIYVPDIRRMSFNVAITMDFPQNPDYFFRVNTFRLVDEDDNIQDAAVEFIIDSVSAVGAYSFSHTTVKYENIYYYSDSTYNGSVNIIKYDLNNGIISGTFSFSAIVVDNSNSQIIQITDGRFDLKK